MKFKDEHPSYKGYENNEYYFSEWPKNFSSALQGFLTRQCNGRGEYLKVVINDIAGRVPMELTTNWGWDYLIQDLPDYVNKLCKLPFPKVMDFLSDACTNNHLPFSVDDLNELLEDLNVGYIFEGDSWGNRGSWKLRSSITSRAEAVDDTTSHVESICEQTLNHLQQARKHLLNTSNDRDRKDAIRDGLSAMEAMMKTLSGESDISDASKALRATKAWGPDIIVKDGLTLWDRMHDLHPDIRHGNPKKSDITDEEALYWLDRITCYIRYIARVHNRGIEA
jgi:hypothetical protein